MLFSEVNIIERKTMEELVQLNSHDNPVCKGNGGPVEGDHEYCCYASENESGHQGVRIKINLAGNSDYRK